MKLRAPSGAFGQVEVGTGPRNRLESLKGDLKACHSIRINDPWRVVFRWSGGSAFDVQIVDYH